MNQRKDIGQGQIPDVIWKGVKVYNNGIIIIIAWPVNVGQLAKILVSDL